jgi:hypothetical protein
MDSGDKATAKAMSVAMRTALLQALCLPTDEPDPDATSYERAPRAAKVTERDDPAPDTEPVAESDGDLMAAIEAASTKSELNALVEVIKAQPQPAQYRAAFMRRQKEVR